MSSAASGGGDGAWRLDDAKDLGIDRDIEVLALSKGLVAMSHPFFDKLCYWVANDGKTDVKDPLESSKIKQG